MSRSLIALVLCACLALSLGVRGRAADADPGAVDEQTLKDAGLPVDGPSLLEFFRKRTLTEAAQQKIQALVKQLGDHSYKIRVKASADLIAEGVVAVPFLRRAIKHPDLEVSRRAAYFGPFEVR